MSRWTIHNGPPTYPGELRAHATFDIPMVDADRAEPLSLDGVEDCTRGVLLFSSQARSACVFIPAAELATIPGQEGRRCVIGPLMPWDEFIIAFVGEGESRVVFALVESEEP